MKSGKNINATTHRDFDAFLENTRYRFTRNVSFMFLLVFIAETVVHFIDNDAYGVMGTATVVMLSSFIYVTRTKNYKSVSILISLTGVTLITYSFFTFKPDSHYDTLLFMIIGILFTFFTLGKNWGTAIVLLFFIGFTGYLITFYNRSMEFVLTYSLDKTIVEIVENAICLFCLTYIIYLFISTNKYAQNQLKGINVQLLDQNKVISDQNEEILIKSKHKEEFLANMSHEIRTPLNAVIGYSSLMIKEPLVDKQMGYMNNINRASNSLLAIVNDILDYSKIEAGKIELEKIPFDLYEEMKHLTSLMNVSALEKNVQLQLEIDPAVSRYVKGDTTRLQQVLINLLNNAIKFTSEGNIFVHLSIEESLGTEQLIRFSVKDNGIGISKDKQQLIFEKFTQSNSSTTRKYGGTGLGLAISSRLVELLGGQLRVLSDEGKGAEFYFTIPLKISDKLDVMEKNTNTFSVPGIEDIKILLADDNEVNRIMAVELFKNWNKDIQIDLACDGLEVIEKINKTKYDVILMDLHMPNKNGIDTTKFIRSSISTEIVIIALTASTLNSGGEHCLEAGMNDFIMKPFKVEDVILKIAKHLNLTIQKT